MKGFGSDNHAGVHHALMESILNANSEHAPSYGTDSWTELANSEFRRIFKKNVFVYFVYNGTSANVLCLRAMTKPWQAVLCSGISHLQNDECGAPENMAGCKLYTLPHENGILSLETLKKSMIRGGDQHYSQPKVISLTQPTELGTCYTIEQIKEITSWAHSQNMYVHVDGARLANAVHFLKTSFFEMLTETQVDVVSFGGTKNGLMMGEAIVFLNTQLAEDFIYIRKQSGQLPSKTRFISSQFHTYLSKNIWKEISGHTHRMALYLENKVRDIPEIQITRPVQSNAVFAVIPKDWVRTLREKYFFYVWDEKTFECRWMMCFDTTEKEIDDFVEEMNKLSKSSF